MSSVTSLPSPSLYSTATFPAARPVLHEQLLDQVDYFAFPDALENNRGAVEAPCGKHDMVRLFVGQLPFCVTDAQLNYAMATVTGGCHVHFVERIVNWKRGRTPTGCVHAYCLPCDADLILAANQRILFDDFGVWCATNDEQSMRLRDYSKYLGQQKDSRLSASMPHHLMTVERAKSTYVRNEDFAIDSFPAYRHGQRRPAPVVAQYPSNEPARFSRVVKNFQ